MKTLVSQRSRFEPSSKRGNFLKLPKYVEIPSIHGDIPVVFCHIYVIELKSKLNRFFFKFLPTLGALFRLLQVLKMQVFMTCIFSQCKNVSYSGKQQSSYAKLLPTISSLISFTNFSAEVQTKQFQETRRLD